MCFWPIWGPILPGIPWTPRLFKFVRQGTALRLPVFAACHKVPPNIDISPRFAAVEKTPETKMHIANTKQNTCNKVYSWWLNQPIWKNMSQSGSSFPGENNTCLKPPPIFDVAPKTARCVSTKHHLFSETICFVPDHRATWKPILCSRKKCRRSASCGPKEFISIFPINPKHLVELPSN